MVSTDQSEARKSSTLTIINLTSDRVESIMTPEVKFRLSDQSDAIQRIRKPSGLRQEMKIAI